MGRKCCKTTLTRVRTAILSSKHAEDFFLSLGGLHKFEVFRLELRQSKHKRRSEIVMHMNVIDFHGIDFFLCEYISIRPVLPCMQVRSRKPISPDAFGLRGLVVL
jgi:hypothetical protein